VGCCSCRSLPLAGAPPPLPLLLPTACPLLPCHVQIFKEAQDLLPGGVNSPVRAFKSVGGQPIVFDHVKGAYCWDADNNKYIDYGAPGFPCCYIMPLLLQAARCRSYVKAAGRLMSWLEWLLRVSPVAFNGAFRSRPTPAGSHPGHPHPAQPAPTR